ASEGWLRAAMRARARGDLETGTFLSRVEEGTASAALEAEAARRALDAGVPWLARLLAARALFLDTGRAGARSPLAAADERVGLAATARKADGKDAAASDADDPAAQRVEEGLRSGLAGDRKVLEHDAGKTAAFGLLPVALAGGLVLHGTASGGVAVVEIA